MRPEEAPNVAGKPKKSLSTALPEIQDGRLETAAIYTSRASEEKHRGWCHMG
jgi:hypothetical protein